jgi:hypothetical protein
MFSVALGVDVRKYDVKVSPIGYLVVQNAIVEGSHRNVTHNLHSRFECTWPSVETTSSDKEGGLIGVKCRSGRNDAIQFSSAQSSAALTLILLRFATAILKVFPTPGVALHTWVTMRIWYTSALTIEHPVGAHPSMTAVVCNTFLVALLVIAFSREQTRRISSRSCPKILCLGYVSPGIIRFASADLAKFFSTESVVLHSRVLEIIWYANTLRIVSRVVAIC